MNHTIQSRLLSCIVLVGLATTAHATRLTFDIYTDTGKTSEAAAGPNPSSAFGLYGDNVTDFTPASPFAAPGSWWGFSAYYNYGTNGGFTPNITVQYLLLTNGTTAGTSGYTYQNLGHALQNVLYPGSTVYGLVPNTYSVITLTPTNNGSVRLESFDVESYSAATPNQTLKVVKDLGLPSQVTLWAAGPDGAVTVSASGTADSYAPMVDVDTGHTLSLIYGDSGNVGMDNVTFSAIPEPSSAVLLTVVGGLAFRRKWKS